MSNGFSFDQPLSNEEQSSLRAKGTLQEAEVAVRAGDLLVAVNTLTGARRPINVESVVTESPNRRLLRD